ncbi:MAG TPA: DUF1993 domain-containing protein [Lysobacter sp.]
MSLSMYAASVPVFRQMLGSLSQILRTAETHAAEKKIDPAALLQARLFPDMFPLVRQVQVACDMAKGVSSRLAGAEVPSHEDTEQTFEDLQARIAKTLAVIEGYDAARFDGSEQREIVLRPGTPKERRFDGQSYLLHYGLPQFFFHVTTAYALLRHNGIEIGKQDYMGAR